jgi:hypothetical protein
VLTPDLKLDHFRRDGGGLGCVNPLHAKPATDAENVSSARRRKKLCRHGLRTRVYRIGREPTYRPDECRACYLMARWFAVPEYSDDPNCVASRVRAAELAKGVPRFVANARAREAYDLALEMKRASAADL